MTKIIIGTKSLLYGNRGIEKNDLSKIANHLSTNEVAILNDNSIQEIKVSEIKINSGDWIDGIQFTYKITKDNKSSLVEGHKFGCNGGGERIINLGDNEHLIRIDGKLKGNVDELKFLTFDTSKNKTISYGKFGGRHQTDSFEIFSEKLIYPLICFFGKSSDNSLSGIGVYEGNISLFEEKFQSQIEVLPPYKS
ncbi:MAG: hypothetical protein mread185_000667 [Mycoplasmataceae bacterium]|nr:MAG: hypothetical protein mread185_000667 [Mycoplasmataceae bacterium]